MPDHAASREPELLTITEAAELLRAPVATLRYWRHLGTGPAASASAAASSTATTTSRHGWRRSWAEAHRDPAKGCSPVPCRPGLVGSLGHAACRTVPSRK